MFIFVACGSNNGGVEVTSISLSTTSISIEIGESFDLSVVINPSNASDQTITWQSGNPNVANVINGTVYANSEGTTDIVAASANGQTAKCTVTVTSPSAYEKLNTDEKKAFNAFVANLSYFSDPSSVRFITIKYHSWDNYDYEFFATVSGKNGYGGTVQKCVGFNENEMASFRGGDLPTDACFNIKNLNDALTEYLQERGY